MTMLRWYGDELMEHVLRKRCPARRCGVEAALQFFQRDRLREVVVLGAVAAAKVTAAGDDELGVNRGVRQKNAGGSREQALNLHALE
jgi:hypothetical protein